MRTMPHPLYRRAGGRITAFSETLQYRPMEMTMWEPACDRRRSPRRTAPTGVSFPARRDAHFCLNSSPCRGDTDTHISK
jgi:hypothetical protein